MNDIKKDRSAIKIVTITVSLMLALLYLCFTLYGLFTSDLSSDGGRKAFFELLIEFIQSILIITAVVVSSIQFARERQGKQRLYLTIDKSSPIVGVLILFLYIYIFKISTFFHTLLSGSFSFKSHWMLFVYALLSVFLILLIILNFRMGYPRFSKQRVIDYLPAIFLFSYALVFKSNYESIYYSLPLLFATLARLRIPAAALFLAYMIQVPIQMIQKLTSSDPSPKAFEIVGWVIGLLLLVFACWYFVDRVIAGAKSLRKTSTASSNN